MGKIKIKNCDIFGGMQAISIKGVRLTESNISNYDLYKMPRKSTDKKDVYKINKKDRDFYIVHDKTNSSVDWFESLE